MFGFDVSIEIRLALPLGMDKERRRVVHGSEHVHAGAAWFGSRGYYDFLKGGHKLRCTARFGVEADKNVNRHSYSITGCYWATEYSFRAASAYFFAPA